METTVQENEGVEASLGLWDTVSIIVGIIIGVGIFETPREIFAASPGPWQALGAWCLGGILALVGAFCFAELATTYPQSGGEYIYLTRAYGSLPGFLYAWAQLAVIRPAGIGAMAYIFAVHAQRLWDINLLLVALLSVALLTLINILGVTFGVRTQNLLTGAKVLGLGAIVVVGFAFSDWQPLSSEIYPAEPNWFARVMISILWTYAGWHEAAYIAAEVKNPQRNLPLALILGTVAVTIIYLLVNVALLLAFGFEGNHLCSTVDIMPGQWGYKAVNILIVVSALGALNGMIFTTARIFSAFGADHRLFTPFSHWSRRLGTPVRALAVQGILGLVYLLVGGLFGEGLQSLNYWIDLTAAVFWVFFLLTGISLFVLRKKDPATPRPFPVPAYPVLPLIFCGWCAYMVIGSIWTSPREAIFGLLILVVGLPFYYLPQKRKKNKPGWKETRSPAATG